MNHHLSAESRSGVHPIRARPIRARASSVATAAPRRRRVDRRYVRAVRDLAEKTPGPVDVYFTSEDFHAWQAFRKAAPANWRVLAYPAAPKSRRGEALIRLPSTG